MAYLRAEFSPEQLDALYAVEPADIRALNPSDRLDLALRHAEYQAREKEAFWNSLQAFATAALPILAFFGITTFFGKRR